MTTLTHHGLDLAAPGGLAALFAFNRARYGDLRMMADPADPPADPPGKTGEDKQFSQADVDRIVATRARQVARSEFGDYDEIKAKAAKFDADQAGKATEIEQAVAKARTEGETAATQRLTTERVLDKVEIAAAGKFADTTDARLRLAERARAGEFTDKAGAIDTAAIKTAVEAELKAAPHLAAGVRRPDVDRGQGGGNPSLSGADLGDAAADRRYGKRENTTR